MFIGGDLSGYIPRDAHGDIRATGGFPNARFAYVSDAGHFVHIDQREKFLEVILPELKGAGKQLPSFKDNFND